MRNNITSKNILLSMALLFPINWLLPETYRQYDPNLSKALKQTYFVDEKQPLYRGKTLTDTKVALIHSQTQISLKDALNSVVSKTAITERPINSPNASVVLKTEKIVHSRSTNCTKRLHLSKSAYTLGEVISAMVIVESHGNRLAKGRSGERGLMQITKAVWLEYSEYPWEYAYNSRLNIEIGTAYLTSLVNKYGLENGIRRYNKGNSWRGKSATRYYHKVLK